MRQTWRVLSLLMLQAMIALCLSSQAVSSLPDQNGVYLPGWGLKPAKLVRAVPAVPPTDPRVDGLKHVCALYVVVGADGTPGEMEIVNKVATPFDDAAKAAVRQSEFEPGNFQRKPVPSWLMVWVPFLGKDHPALPVAGPIQELKSLRNPVPIVTPEAEFSQEARSRRKDGSVGISFLLTEDGLPSRERVVNHAGYGLDEKAMEAVHRYRFRPATLEGVPVPFIITVQVNFRLDQSF